VTTTVNLNPWVAALILIVLALWVYSKVDHKY
jgi:hypothetical protein